MPYIDYSYYAGVFMGASVDEADFPALEMRASEIIDELTMYKVAQSSLTVYSTFIQEQFKKALCAEIEYINGIGGVDALSEQKAQSMSLGKFNYSGMSDSGTNSFVSPNVEKYLAITGLMYRGID